MSYMEQMADQAIEAGLQHQKEFYEETVLETTKKASKAALKWFYETFDDDLLEKMEEKGLISQAEGFSTSAVAELQATIEIEILGKLAD